MFVLTAVLGQIVSNTATVLIVAPIAVSAAAATHTSVQPVLMLIAVAGSAALLTPIATPANLMVMTPGGYRFGDYWRLGLPGDGLVARRQPRRHPAGVAVLTRPALTPSLRKGTP